MTEIEQIKKILEKQEKRISNLEKLFKTKPISIISEEEIVLNLINSGFFDEHKTLGKLKKELIIQAKLDKKADYTKILEKLTRENKLTRKIVGHQWSYEKNG